MSVVDSLPSLDLEKRMTSVSSTPIKLVTDNISTATISSITLQIFVTSQSTDQSKVNLSTVSSSTNNYQLFILFMMFSFSGRATNACNKNIEKGSKTSGHFFEVSSKRANGEFKKFTRLLLQV